MERHMTDEALTSRLLDAISEITRLGGEEERTSIVPGILVVDAAPNDLPSGYIKIQNPRDGTYVPCLTVSGLVVADNDLVNVLFAKGTEPIAISQASGSPSSGVKVSEVWESDFGAVAGSADASGNWTWQNNVILDGGNLTFTGVGQINATGGIGFGDGGFNPLIIDANNDVIVNNSQGGADFLVRGDGGTSLFFVDVANEAIIINESGEDVDVRIESDNLTDAFFVQGSNGNIGVGMSVPSFAIDALRDTNGRATIHIANPNTGTGAWADVLIRADNGAGGLHGYAVQMFGDGNTGTWDSLGLSQMARFRSDSTVDGLIITTGGAAPIYFGTSDTRRMTIEADGDIVIGATTALGQLHVDQSSIVAAQPVLYLDQADLSEEFIEFASTVGAGNPIDTAAVGTPYAKVRVSVAGVGFKFLQLYN